MPRDYSASLQTAVTKTATFQGTGLDLITGTPKRGLWARFNFASFLSTTAGSTFTPSIEHSDDNTTFTTLTTGSAVTGATAANTSTVPQLLNFFTKKRYVRSAMTIASGSGPTITYSVDLVASPNLND